MVGGRLCFTGWRGALVTAPAIGRARSAPYSFSPRDRGSRGEVPHFAPASGSIRPYASQFRRGVKQSHTKKLRRATRLSMAAAGCHKQEEKAPLFHYQPIIDMITSSQQGLLTPKRPLIRSHQ